jgi:hypothetical protein
VDFLERTRGFRHFSVLLFHSLCLLIELVQFSPRYTAYQAHSTAYSEVKIDLHTPVRKGYAFLPKGNAYNTLHCRKLTREASELLYIVVDNNTALGLRAPKSVLSQVFLKAKSTLATRRAATLKRDTADSAKAAAEIKAQFPKTPEQEVALVLKHGFRKYSGRVGRSSTMPLDKKVTLAVIAHVRHKHTKYDTLLREGKARDDARKAIWKDMETILRKWGYSKGRH